MTEIQIDNSKRETFQKCPYRFDLAHNRGIYPIFGSTALRYGTTFHAGMEGFYSHIKEYGWAKDGGALERAILYAKEAWEEESGRQTFYEDYRTFDNCVKSLVLYINHFATDEGMLEVMETERAFRIELEPGITFTGRLDLDMKLSGHRWINEFKTTGREITFVSNQQSRSFQFVGYSYAMSRIYDQPPEGILITYHQLNAYKSKKTGEYGEPKIVFDRIPLLFNEQDFVDWELAIISTAIQMGVSEETSIWPKNFDSCYIYGACPYLFLCEQKRPYGEENLADRYVIRQPWNVLDTVPEDKIITI